MPRASVSQKVNLRPWKPSDIQWASPKQEEAFRYGPAPLCVSGGFGAAKTYALCLKVLYLCDLFPKNRFVIARKVSKELERTTKATFFKICPPSAYDPRYGGRRADSENYLRLAHSESEILWLHLDDPDIEGVIRGLEINGFVLDQAEEITEETFDMLSSRLGRWDQAIVPDSLIESQGGIDKWEWKNPMGKPIPPVYAMLACNPDAETHWIYRRFHPDSEEWKEKYKEQGYRMITMKSHENKFLPKQNLDEMMRKDQSFIRRFVEAEWGIPEGQIHNIRDESLIPGTQALADFLKTRGIIHRTLDHGDAAPTCCVAWSVLQSGDIFGVWEYYKPNALVSEHRANITELSKEDRFYTSLADPSMFYKTMQKYGGRYSYADDYSDRNPLHGFDPSTAITWLPADNDEMGTRNIINEYLRPQGTGEILRGLESKEFGKITVNPGQEIPRVHPITNEYGYWPRLFFITKSEEYPHGCDRVIAETRAQRRVKIGTELGKPIFSDERQKGVIDHAHDCLRYFASSRAAAPRVPVPTYGKNSFYGRRDAMQRFKKNGGWQRIAKQLA